MMKTKSWILTFLLSLPFVVAQTENKNILSPLTNVLSQIFETVGNVIPTRFISTDVQLEGGLRLLIFIITLAVMRDILKRTLGKTGTQYQLEDKTIKVIAAVISIVVAFLTPVQLVFRSVAILLVFLSAGLLIVLYWSFADHKPDTQAKLWMNLGILAGLFIVIQIFGSAFSDFDTLKIGNFALASLPDKDYIKNILTSSDPSKPTFVSLSTAAIVIAMIVNVVLYFLNKSPTELKQATAEETADKEAKTAAKKRRDIAVSKKTRTAINAIIALMEKLEEIMLSVKNNDLTAFIQQKDNYRRLFAQLIASEGALETEPGDKIEIPKKLQAIINKETDLMRIVNAGNKELLTVMNFFITNRTARLLAGTQDQVYNIIMKRMVPTLKMLLQLNQEEEKTEATTP